MADLLLVEPCSDLRQARGGIRRWTCRVRARARAADAGSATALDRQAARNVSSPSSRANVQVDSERPSRSVKLLALPANSYYLVMTHEPCVGLPHLQNRYCRRDDAAYLRVDRFPIEAPALHQAFCGRGSERGGSSS